jgi:hypothetical protein
VARHHRGREVWSTPAGQHPRQTAGPAGLGAARDADSPRFEKHAIQLARAARVILDRFHQVLVDSHGVIVEWWGWRAP